MKRVLPLFILLLSSCTQIHTVSQKIQADLKPEKNFSPITEISSAEPSADSTELITAEPRRSSHLLHNHFIHADSASAVPLTFTKRIGKINSHVALPAQAHLPSSPGDGTDVIILILFAILLLGGGVWLFLAGLAATTWWMLILGGLMGLIGLWCLIGLLMYAFVSPAH